MTRLAKQLCQAKIGDIDESIIPEGNDISLFQAPPASDSDDDDKAGCDATHDQKVTALNQFLEACGMDPFVKLSVSWDTASTKTKSRHVNQAGEMISAALAIIAPNSTGSLWQAVVNSNIVNERLSIGTSSEYLNAFVEAYLNATQAESRRQILSILVDTLSLKQLRALIPGITGHQFTMAKKYQLMYGRGAERPSTSPQVREKVDISTLEHFLDFITSSHVIQDMPFGTKKLKLSSGEEFEIPNVIRLMIPSRLVRQYQQFCKENNYQPLGYSTLMKVLSKSCIASVRRCLQGLDNFVSEGSKGFDELIKILDELEKLGYPHDDVKRLTTSLREGRQYLKGDFKVPCINLFSRF